MNEQKRTEEKPFQFPIINNPSTYDQKPEAEGVYRFFRNGVEFFEYWRKVPNPLNNNEEELRILGISNAKALGQEGIKEMKIFLDDAWETPGTLPPALHHYVETIKRDTGGLQ